MPRKEEPMRCCETLVKQAVLALEERLAEMETTLRRAGLATQASSYAGEASMTPEAQATSSESSSTPAAQLENPRVSSKLPDFAAVRKYLTQPAPVIEGPTFPRRKYTPEFDRHDLSTLWLPLTPSVASAFPLINAECLVGRFQGDDPAADALFDSASGWAYACVSMALGSTLKCLNQAAAAMYPRMWPWFMNALATVAELTTISTDALAVQALVGMAVFIQGSAASSLAVSFTASAAALSNRLGLHRGGGNDGLVRSRIFWAAYILDKSAALYHGVPPAIPDDEVEADLPSVDVFYLRLRAQLATMQSRIHSSLYTARALALPGPDVFRAVLEAEKMMDGWRRTLPTELADAIVDGAVGRDGEEPTGAQLDIVMTFNTAQMLVHWSRFRLERDQAVSLTVGVKDGDRLTGDSINLPHDRHCRLRCRSGAMAVIHAFCSVPAPPYMSLWRVVCHPLCAMIVLLVDILEEPATAPSTRLLQTIKTFTTFLENFQHEERCDLSRLIAACTIMLWTAQAAVQTARGETDVVAPEAVASANPEKLLLLLRSATSPMTLAQALIGNQPNRDSALAAEVAALVACPDSRPIGATLAPDALCPSTYGFNLDGGM
ncbi:hypothetical protein F5X68DRAFT_224844 [Plectosphaerella plurivora]|uniref:Xylanolytic transcriptional activator regulatory domain-containing protein n=1 Tax=Plectosphaerella plurivora TaxID=936078 RepID=A0A9P8V3K0_9PEZI|nr:hypothetical protein F5X68DRAFT_224844 [Plectosphaerella plurivora]